MFTLCAIAIILLPGITIVSARVTLFIPAFIIFCPQFMWLWRQPGTLKTDLGKPVLAIVDEFLLTALICVNLQWFFALEVTPSPPCAYFVRGLFFLHNSLTSLKYWLLRWCHRGGSRWIIRHTSTMWSWCSPTLLPSSTRETFHLHTNPLFSLLCFTFTRDHPHPIPSTYSTVDGLFFFHQWSRTTLFPHRSLLHV